MKIFEIQIIASIADNFINVNYWEIFSTILNFLIFIQDFLEHYKEKAWRKMFAEAVVLTVVVIALHGTDYLIPVLSVAALPILVMTIHKRKKQGEEIKETISNSPDPQTNDMMGDSTEGDYKPKVLQFSQSVFDKAEQCLAEEQPKKAIEYLKEYRGKKKSKHALQSTMQMH